MSFIVNITGFVGSQTDKQYSKLIESAKFLMFGRRIGDIKILKYFTDKFINGHFTRSWKSVDEYISKFFKAVTEKCFCVGVITCKGDVSFLKVLRSAKLYMYCNSTILVKKNIDNVLSYLSKQELVQIEDTFYQKKGRERLVSQFVSVVQFLYKPVQKHRKAGIEKYNREYRCRRAIESTERDRYRP